MRTLIPDLISSTTFQPEDLATMQRAFDEACRRRGNPATEAKLQIAQTVLQLYASGERDPQKLVASALSVEPQAERT